MLEYIAELFYYTHNKEKQNEIVQILSNSIQTVNQARDFFGFFFQLLLNDNEELWKLTLGLEVGTMLLKGINGEKIIKKVISNHYNSIEEYIKKRENITKEYAKGK